MNCDDCEKYWYPASDNVLRDCVIPNRAKELDVLLGVRIYADYMRRESLSDFPLAEPMRRLCTKLAGPHGKTILKAYRIKHGLET